MAEKYKLLYFNARGRAEPIRLIFAYAGVEFEDRRFELAEWPALKNGTKWGVVPVLEVNGEPMGEVSAIIGYLSRKYGIAGQTPWEQFRVDELLSAFGDVVKIRDFVVEQDPAKKEAVRKNYVEKNKPLFAKVSALKEKNGGKWLVGEKLTAADLLVAHGLSTAQIVDPSILAEFPGLQKLQDEVFEVPQIKKWIETRPKTFI